MADQADSTKVNRSPILSVTLVALTAIVGALILVYFYLRPESPCYWSDFNSYEWATRFSLTRLSKDPLFYPILLLGSVSLQHNLFFTVPLLPLMALLGGGRLAFISATTIMYLLPLAFLIVRLSKVVENRPQKNIGRSLLLVLLLPVIWAPCLRGYPDCGAALTLLAALLIYLEERSFTSLKRGAAIGVLLALTVLLRRYFAFAGVALVITIVVDQLLLLKRQSQDRRIFREKSRTMLALTCGGAATMICLGFPFLLNLTRLNLGALYDSYHVSPATSFAYFFSCFGLITLLLSGTGYLLALRSRLAEPGKVLFILCFFALAEALWIFGPGELGTHYTLYFSPLIALGVVLGFDAISTGTLAIEQKALLLGPLSLFLVANFALSLLPAKIVDGSGLTLFRPGMLSLADQEGKGAALLFSAGYAPNIRDDRLALEEIISGLRSEYKRRGEIDNDDKKEADGDETNPLSKRAQVCVVASSNLLNSEVLRNTERAMYGLDQDKIPWLELPVVDSKDSYPLERLLACRYVIIPSRPLYFIPPGGQTLLRSALACFNEGWPLASDFTQWPEIFCLSDGLKVKVFERRQATSEANAALTLQEMQDFVGKEPGSQPTWTTTGQLSQICYDKKRNSWLFLPGRKAPEGSEGEKSYLLYSAKEPFPSRFDISGVLKMNAQAPTTTIRARLLDEKGNQLSNVSIIEVTQSGDSAKFQKVPFKQSFEDKKARFLVIELEFSSQAVQQSARIRLDDLQLQALTNH